MRRFLLAAAVLVAVLVPGTPAWAHTRLVSSDPAENATLARAPAAVTVEFSQRLNPDFTTIAVSDTAKRLIPATPPAVDTVRATVTFDQPLPNGTFTVAYRVVSVDGHTVQNAYTFTVADPALPAAAAVPLRPPAAPGGVPIAVIIGGGAAGVVLVAVAAWWFRSGRRRVADPSVDQPAI